MNIYRAGVKACITNQWRIAPQEFSLTEKKEWYAGYDEMSRFANIELARIVMKEQL